MAANAHKIQRIKVIDLLLFNFSGLPVTKPNVSNVTQPYLQVLTCEFSRARVVLCHWHDTCYDTVNKFAFLILISFNISKSLCKKIKGRF